VLFASVNGFVLSFIENQIGVSLALAMVYFSMATVDFTTGVYKNVIKKKDKFRSELFLKKILSVCIMAISLSATTHLVNYTASMQVPNVVIDHFQGVVVYAFNLVKIFIVVAFLGYEMTSIRENAEELKWHSLVDIIDVFLLPITLIKEKLQKKIKDETKIN
jgi:hypothetical protein